MAFIENNPWQLFDTAGAWGSNTNRGYQQTDKKLKWKNLRNEKSFESSDIPGKLEGHIPVQDFAHI